MLFAILPLQFVALVSVTSVPPVTVTLFDANHQETHVVQIGRDGSLDAKTDAELRYAFRCRRSGREPRVIDPGLLAMIAEVQQHWPDKTIEYISAYRNWSGEDEDSPHRAGRAFDFRVPGVSLIALRDWLWTHFEHVGIGWYPTKNFVHMDPREQDIAWTFIKGANQYHPSWAERLRSARPVDGHESRVGI